MATVSLSPLGGAGWQFLDNNANPLSGGLIYTYRAGSSSPAATYTSSAGDTLNPNPIVLDAAGRPPEEIWTLADQAYKFTVREADGSLVRTYDNLPAWTTAADITFLQEGTGAVPRSAQSKMRDIVNVADFGAVGDNATNDSAAIQAAINAHSEVQFEAGLTYFCSSTITVPSNRRLLFNGAKVRLGTAGTRLFYTADGATNIYAENGELIGVSGPSTVANEFGFALRNATKCKLVNMVSHGFGTDGIYNGPDTADDNVFEDCVGYNNGRQGISIAGGNRALIRGGRYYDNTLYGVDIEGSTAGTTTVTEVEAYGNVNGINSDTTTTGRNIISNCRCHGNDDHGIQTAAVGDKVYGNACYDNGKNGIFGLNTGASVTNNECYGNGQNGIRGDLGTVKNRVNASLNDCHDNVRSGISLSRYNDGRFVGNICQDNDSGDSTTYFGIECTGNVTNCLFEANVLANTVGGVKQRRGISFNTSTSNDNTVIGNRFANNKQGPVLDNGTGNKFVNNQGYVNRNGGLRLPFPPAERLPTGLPGPRRFSVPPQRLPRPM